MVDALPADERPLDLTPVHTADLPMTPTRDHSIPVDAWIEAPDELRSLGDDIGQPKITYKRRIGRGCCGGRVLRHVRMPGIGPVISKIQLARIRSGSSPTATVKGWARAV